jgi:hypothetical protein
MKVTNVKSKELDLTEEEAFALLGLCITSPEKLDATAEQAMRKLASYCKSRVRLSADRNHHISGSDHIL